VLQCARECLVWRTKIFSFCGGGFAKDPFFYVCDFKIISEKRPFLSIIDILLYKSCRFYDDF
jgi:hypothetical protein